MSIYDQVRALDPNRTDFVVPVVSDDGTGPGVTQGTKWLRDDLRAAMKRAAKLEGLTFDELARRTGLSMDTLRRFETGETVNPPLDLMGRIRSGLNESGRERKVLAWVDAGPEDDD